MSWSEGDVGSSMDVLVLMGCSVHGARGKNRAPKTSKSDFNLRTYLRADTHELPELLGDKKRVSYMRVMLAHTYGQSEGRKTDSRTHKDVYATWSQDMAGYGATL